METLRLTQLRHNAAQTYIVGDINSESAHWPTMFSSSAEKQLIINDPCELNFQQLLITLTGKSPDVFFCNKPQNIVSVDVDNQMKDLFSSNHSPFFVKSCIDFQPKHELKPPPKLKHDFATFAYKKANCNEINQFIIDHPFDPNCKNNVDLMADLWYERLYVILQDFLTIKTKHCVTLALWVGNESSRLIKKLKTLQKSYRTKSKPALKAKVEETQIKLTLSPQND